MNFLEEKEENNAASLQCYASGDGSLGFVYQDRTTRNAIGLRVTNRDVDAFIAQRRPDLKAWKKLFDGHSFKLYQPCHRSAHDEITVGGRSFRYVRVHEQCFHVFNEEGEETQNSNIKGAVMFFVNNEAAINSGR